MSNDYGSELVNVLEELNPDLTRIARESASYGLPIGAIISRRLLTAGTILYFPPGNYVLEAREGNLPYVCARGVQLFFATGALLRLDDGVVFVIRGTIRASNQQIFGFNATVRSLTRGQNVIDLDRLSHPFRTWPVESIMGGDLLESVIGGGLPAGRIIIESDDIPLVRPEWWGADIHGDCWGALQGAIDAACVGRAGRSPIPIVLAGPYRCFRTLEVRAPADAKGHLRPVSLVLRGAAGVGGTSSLIRTYDQSRPRPEGLQISLRLHPGVDFDFRDLKVQCADELDGCVEVLCSSQETTLRRGFMQRVTMIGGLDFQLRIVESGSAATPRHFVLDSCLLRATQFIPSVNVLRLDVGPTVMLRVSNSGLAGAELAKGVLQLPPQALEQASCLLIGGSVMLDSLMFHNAAGPRPSRDPPELDRPDGQDMFLGVPSQRDRPTTHLTTVQCESQSWWILSRDSRVSRAHQAVLMGFAHAMVVWHEDTENPVRRNVWYQQWRLTHPDLPVALVDPGATPSVVWLRDLKRKDADKGQCVLIGCRLTQSIVMNDVQAVVDFATVFYTTDLGETRKLFRRPSQMISLGTGYVPVTAFREGVFDEVMPRLVPILRDLLPETME